VKGFFFSVFNVLSFGGFHWGILLTVFVSRNLVFSFDVFVAGLNYSLNNFPSMSLLSFSVRAPLSLHNEASCSSGVGAPGGASRKAAPRANFLQRNARDSVKKASVHHKFDRVSRYA